jgi:hypothetical protein
MLNLDQVRLLENRVEKAVAKIQGLTSENDRLTGEIEALQSRVRELEGLVNAFKDDQGKIEQGILNALDRLSAFEDSILHAPVAEAGRPAAMRVAAAGPSTQTAPKSAVSPAGETKPVITEAMNLSPADLDIEADWQDAAPAAPASDDGQMDIF